MIDHHREQETSEESDDRERRRSRQYDDGSLVTEPSQAETGESWLFETLDSDFPSHSIDSRENSARQLQQQAIFENKQRTRASLGPADRGHSRRRSIDINKKHPRRNSGESGSQVATIYAGS